MAGNELLAVSAAAGAVAGILLQEACTEEPLHHKMEQTLYKKTLPLLQRYTFIYCTCLYALFTIMHESQDKD